LKAPNKNKNKKNKISSNYDVILVCYTNIAIEFLLSNSFISSLTIYIIVFLAFWQAFPLKEHGVGSLPYPIICKYIIFIL